MAVTLTLDQIAAALDVEITEEDPADPSQTRDVEPERSNVSRLLAAVAGIVDKYAPDAPDAISDEAALRFAGYLYGSEASGYGTLAKIDAGGVTVEQSTNHGLAFRNSGAKWLLSGWKVRHAGKCS